MTLCLSKGFTKVMQKVLLTVIAAYAYNVLSVFVPSCPLVKNGWKIYPFDKKFFPSSMLFMTSAAITIAECDVWPYNTKPQHKIIRFMGELYIMTTCMLLVYVLFWHPVVIVTSIATDRIAILTHKWLVSPSIYKKSIPVCMENVRSTKFHCILLGVLLLYHVLDKTGKTDLRRIRNSF